MAINFFLFNTLSCLLLTTKQLLGLTLQQETKTFWEVFVYDDSDDGGK